MAVNPYTSQAISGYNASPPPDDGTQTDANKLAWSKHKTKLNDPIKTLAEGVNTQALSAFNTLALEDWSSVTTTATIAETDWHNGIIMLATKNINYPDPSTFEDGWHNYVFNGATGPMILAATATGFFRDNTGVLASGVSLQAGEGVKVMNTATVWLVIGQRATATSDPNAAMLNVAQTWTKRQGMTAVALTGTATIAFDASLSNLYTLSISATGFGLGNPTSLVAGNYTVVITNNNTASIDLAYGSAYYFPARVKPTLSTATAGVDILYMTCDDGSKMRVAFNTAFGTATS